MVNWVYEMLPEDLRRYIFSAIGLPPFAAGRLLFVDVVNGSDTGAEYNNPLKAYASLTAAEDAGRDGYNDVVVLIGDGSTAATARLESTLTWDKDALHLIGVTADSYFAKRSRISHLTSATTNINPLINHTSQGCIFKNFSFFQGIGQSSTDEQLFHVTGGQRNLYENIDFGGMGHANGAARAGSHVVQMTDGAECTFRRCTIGLDTIARGDVANASLRLRYSSSGSKRNVFEDCLFPAITSGTSMLFVDADQASAFNGGINLFNRCGFYALDNTTPGSAPAVAIVVNATANGEILLNDCWANNISAWAANSARVKVNMVVPVDDEAGVMVNAAD